MLTQTRPEGKETLVDLCCKSAYDTLGVSSIKVLLVQIDESDRVSNGVWILFYPFTGNGFWRAQAYVTYSKSNSRQVLRSAY